jgi:hypothetical protein
MLAIVRVCALLMLLGFVSPSGSAEQAMPLPQTWNGRLVLPEGIEPGLTGDQLELRIVQISSDKEISELVEELRVGGQPALRNAMFALHSKGWIQIGKLGGTEIVTVRVADLPDGRRRLRLYSERPLRLYDDSDPPGSEAHPFGFIELVAGASGKGTGQLIAAASLALNEEGGLHIESAGTPVIKIIEVTTDRPPGRAAKP